MQQGQQDWITKRVDGAQRLHPVADGIVSTIKNRLAGTMSERVLSARELTDLAMILVDVITTPQSETTNK